VIPTDHATPGAPAAPVLRVGSEGTGRRVQGGACGPSPSTSSLPPGSGPMLWPRNGRPTSACSPSIALRGCAWGGGGGPPAAGRASAAGGSTWVAWLSYLSGGPRAAPGVHARPAGHTPPDPVSPAVRSPKACHDDPRREVVPTARPLAGWPSPTPQVPVANRTHGCVCLGPTGGVWSLPIWTVWTPATPSRGRG
jgi:hypothetical protein